MKKLIPVLMLLFSTQLKAQVKFLHDSYKAEYFNGTRKFCDEFSYWMYVVQIKDSDVNIRCFPGAYNSDYKDKSKPIACYNGKIKNGKIVTKDPPEYLTNRFKYENDVFYEVNTEGSYNDFPLCPRYKIDKYRVTKHKIAISQNALKEFARCANYQFNYGNGTFKAMVYQSFRSEKRTSDIEVMMENLEKKPNDAIEVLDVVWNYCRNNEDFLFQNLRSMRISATSTKALTDYLISKHGD